MAQPNQVRRRNWLLAVPVLVVLLVVGAFIGARLAHRGSSRPVERIRQWVAVLDVGTDARSLYVSAADVGKVAGVYVFVDRWACYEGFPPGSAPPGQGWFLGVGATDRGVVDGIVAELGRTPIVEAEVEQGCAPPIDTTPVANQT